MLARFENFLTTLSKIFKLYGPILVLAFTALHGLGLFEKVPWLEINFAFVGLWFTTLVLEYSIDNHEKLEEVKVLAKELKTDSTALRGEMNLLNATFHLDRIDSLQDSHRTLDAKIDRIVGPYIDEHIQVLDGVFHRKTIEMDKRKFLVMYRDTLKSFPACEIFATSYPSARYFWKDSETERAMGTFITNGGLMTRIFFLDRLSELEDDETKAILQRQKNMNVSVHTLVVDDVPRDWQRVFLVEGEGRIGWELTLSRQLDIEKAVIYWDPGKTKELRSLFDKLIKTDGRTEFTGSAT